MKTPREILAFCGSDEVLAPILGVSARRIDRMRRSERLPASWLDALENIARRPLDRDAFTFKRPPADGAKEAAK